MDCIGTLAAPPVLPTRSAEWKWGQASHVVGEARRYFTFKPADPSSAMKTETQPSCHLRDSPLQLPRLLIMQVLAVDNDGPHGLAGIFEHDEAA
jgi:hypothetical protein